MRKWRLTSAFYSGERRQSQTELCLCVKAWSQSIPTTLADCRPYFDNSIPRVKSWRHKGISSLERPFFVVKLRTHTQCPPAWCLPCHGKMSTERFQRRHNKTVIDICDLLRQQFCLVFCKDANRKTMWCHNRPFVTFQSIFSYVQCKCCQKYIYKCSKRKNFIV